MHPRTPNIGAVARAAGVSVGTVSNALNAPDRLAPETLDRVLGASSMSSGTSAARPVAP